MSKELVQLHERRKDEIRKRLDEFKSVLDKSDEKVFAELAFCICTPQSKATSAWSAIKSLVENRMLFTGNEDQIKPFLNAVRFNEQKASRIVDARRKFTSNGKLALKSELMKLADDPTSLREWVRENVKGCGLKESSHFIRNIGLSNNQLAILDVHILKNLKELGVIDEIPKSLTEKKYLEIESKMKNFADKLGITLDELDIVLWSKETGMIFK